MVYKEESFRGSHTEHFTADMAGFGLGEFISSVLSGMGISSVTLGMRHPCSLSFFI